jgi:hypothetical protein
MLFYASVSAMPDFHPFFTQRPPENRLKQVVDASTGAAQYARL